LLFRLGPYVQGETGSRRTASTATLSSRLPFETPERILLGIRARLDAKISQGHLIGNIAPDTWLLALSHLKPEQLPLFGPVGGKFEGQPH
jgi:hypothetical protein